MKRLPVLLLVLVSLVSGPRAALPGLTYYFRDFSLTYAPLRAFLAAELRHGRWPWWNPYVYEGAPFLPMFYPLELLQALAPGPAFASWLLTLHFPIAALGMYALARDVGAERRGAFVAGAVYALGGLTLSSLPLHWFLQALALAPLVALTLKRAVALGGRAVVIGAAVLALAISTLAVEFVAQGLALGLGLGLAARADRRGAGRAAAACGLGLGLASLPIALMLGIAGESLRGAGLGAARLLDRPLPPLALLQVLVPDLLGSITQPLRYWWGGRIFSGGPYFMSLYLGPVVLALAATGFGAMPRVPRAVVLTLGGLGLWYALGRSLGLAAVVAPVLHLFRFPVKAVLLPCMALALGCGFGIDRLAAAAGTRRLALWATGLGVLGALVAGVGGGVPSGLVAWLDISPATTVVMQGTLWSEGLQATALAVVVVVLALGVGRRWISGTTAASLAALLVVADLARAGAGMNPQVSPAFFEALPGIQAALRDPEGGRVFSYGADRSPVLAAWAAARPEGVERWSFFLSRQLASPFSNVADRVETAEGPDRLSFVVNPPALQPADYAPDAVGGILPRLRAAGVSRLTSLDPLTHGDLALLARVPAGPAGLAVHVYALANAWPRAFLACQVGVAQDRYAARERLLLAGPGARTTAVLEVPLPVACREARVQRLAVEPGRDEYQVSSDGPGVLVTRDTFAPGWRASVDGRPASVLRVNGRHRAVAVPAGAHTVALRYEPPGLWAGVVLNLLAVAMAGVLWRRAGRGSLP
jgi:hypothetical protein